MADHIGDLLRALSDFDPAAAGNVADHAWSRDEAAEILSVLMWELELAADQPKRITSAFVSTVEFRLDDV